MVNFFNLNPPAANLSATSGEAVKNGVSAENSTDGSMPANFMFYLNAVMNASGSEDSGAVVDEKNVIPSSPSKGMTIDFSDQEKISSPADQPAANYLDGLTFSEQDIALLAALFGVPTDGEATLLPGVQEDETDPLITAAVGASQEKGLEDLINLPALESAFYNDEGQIGLGKFPTAEEYMERFEEMLKAAKEVLAWVKTEGYMSSDFAGAETDSAETMIQPANGGASAIFERSEGMVTAVMPGKGTGVSAMAAEITEITEIAEIVEDQPDMPADKNSYSGLPDETSPEASEVAELITPDDAVDVKPEHVNKERPADVKTDRVAEYKTEQVKDPVTAEQKQAPIISSGASEPKHTPLKDMQAVFTKSEPVAQQAGQANKTEQVKQSDGNSEGKGAKDGNSEKFANTLNNTANRASDNVKTADYTAKKETASQEKPTGDQFVERAEVRTQSNDSAQPKTVERSMQWQSIKDIENFARIVQQAGKEGVSRLTVRLTPEHLGRIEIQLTEVGGRIDAKILASSHESRNILASHGDAIRQQLLEKGIHIDNMDFNFHDTLARQDQGGQEYSEGKYTKQPKHNQRGFGESSGEEQSLPEENTTVKSDTLYA